MLQQRLALLDCPNARRSSGLAGVNGASIGGERKEGRGRELGHGPGSEAPRRTGTRPPGFWFSGRSRAPEPKPSISRWGTTCIRMGGPGRPRPAPRLSRVMYS